MRIGSLFSGVGGLELGLEWSGLGQTVWQVEQNEFCLAVLKKHWPNVERFTDVKEVGASTLAPVDLICGGFPCQDVSSAGKGAGIKVGTRSGLWFEFRRIIAELKPRFVVVENVASGARRWLPTVRGDLHVLGYDSKALGISARDVGAPHLRRRVFVLAHAYSDELRQQQGRGTGASGQGKAVVADNGEAERVANANGQWELQPQGSVEDFGGRVSDRSELVDNATRGNEPEKQIVPIDDSPGRALSIGPGTRASGGSVTWLPTERGGEQRESVTEMEGRSVIRQREHTWSVEPDVGRVAHGVPARVDRLKSLGNAVVPQCAQIVGEVILGML